MRVELLQIGSLSIHSYGFLIAVGMILGTVIALRRAKKFGLSGDHLINIVLICMILGWGGGKVLFCIINFKQLLADPISVIGSSGFVVYGGIISGFLFTLLYCHIKKISFLDYFDLATPSIMLAQSIGRLGCFMAGCCYGKPTDAWWGVTFPEGSFAPSGVSLIPTQIISSVGDFVFFLILIAFARKNKVPGRVGSMYLTFYAVGRFCIEFLRGNEMGYIGVLTTAQFISVWILVLSVVMFIICGRQAKKSTNAEASVDTHASDNDTENNTDIGEDDTNGE